MIKSIPTACRLVIKLAGLLMVAALLLVNSVEAMSADQRKVIDSGAKYFNIDQGQKCSSAGTTAATSGIGLASGTSIYVIGDSITYGMKGAGLEQKLTDAGLIVTKINAVPAKDLSWGLSQIEGVDSDIVKNSQAVLVGLGTNELATVVTQGPGSKATEGGAEIFKREAQSIVDAINQNSSEPKQIFWTNFNMIGTYNNYDMDLAMPILNNAIKEVALANNITIIPWDTHEKAKEWLVVDGIHPYPGYSSMGDFVVSTLKDPTSVVAAYGNTVSAVCSCSITGNGGDRDARFKAAWDYLTNIKGLSPEAAAGLMGNLDAESGIDPHNTQDSAPTGDAPEIPIDIIRSRWGYGIAQWTFAARQEELIAFAKEKNMSTGDLGLQLDFLWKELSEKYVGVLTVLQTPGVTLNEASDEVLLRFETPLSVIGGGLTRQTEIDLRRLKGQAVYNQFSGQSGGSYTGAGCNVSGSAIDLESSDTSAIRCESGTSDAGITKGYIDGREITLRLCSVGGGKVNSQISGSIARMLADSQAAGVKLALGDTFRSMEEQIAVYRSWCSRGGITPTPPPYPKASYQDYTRCPGGAAPGWSNHQAGLAIDFMCNSQIIPQSFTAAQNNSCFQWLTANGSRYGLYEFGKGEKRGDSGYEAWHWSVDGS